jgi:hypothetical protein
MATLSTAAKAQVQSAIDYLREGTALNLPISENLLARLAPAAVSSGFVPTTGAFYERMTNEPIRTLLGWITVLGS